MKINKDTDALLVVDVQNDFITGSLAVPNAVDIIPVINSIIPKFTTIIYSADSHIKDHPSFQAQGGPWPDHCVIGSFGHRLHKDLLVRTGNPVIVHKGLKEEAYSAFSGLVTGELNTEKTVEGLLRTLGTKRLFICGLATDYCVKATVLDALKLFDGEVYVLLNAVRSVDINKTDGIRAIDEMGEAGAMFIATSDLED